MSAHTSDSIERLIETAAALLEARAHEMVTIVEWQELRDALAACGRTIGLDEADAPH